jgi:hypothetical protein
LNELLAVCAASKRIANFNGLRDMARRNWPNPVPAIVTKRLLSLIQLTVDGELAERRLAEPRQCLWPANESRTWDSLNNPTHASAANGNVGDFKRE